MNSDHLLPLFLPHEPQPLDESTVNAPNLTVGFGKSKVDEGYESDDDLGFNEAPKDAYDQMDIIIQYLHLKVPLYLTREEIVSAYSGDNASARFGWCPHREGLLAITDFAWGWTHYFGDDIWTVPDLELIGEEMIRRTKHFVLHPPRDWHLAERRYSNAANTFTALTSTDDSHVEGVGDERSDLEDSKMIHGNGDFTTQAAGWGSIGRGKNTSTYEH